MTIDLNCDLGENEPPERTTALMRLISSANVACGAHAGNRTTMLRCIRLAKENQVRLGAHPGYPDRKNFGRAPVQITRKELESLLIEQVELLQSLAEKEGVPLHHIKLHGALYHATDDDRELAKAYVELVRSRWPHLLIYAPGGGMVNNVAYRHKYNAYIWREEFLDRNYQDDGLLVPRDEPMAFIISLPELKQRIKDILTGRITTISGNILRITADTVCVHGDLPYAVEVAEAAAKALGRK
jgi:5-oxoprolinase (ATP-hydrolysing) subunit A